MKRYLKVAALIGASCLALAVVPRFARSADHQDGPAAKADPTSDINDLYSWMDGNNAVFALTVFPDAPAGALFSDKVQYVIHTTSAPAFGGAETAEDVVCTFSGTTAPQTASCWLSGTATDAFVTGNATAEAGIGDAKFKVFAGLRKDPFFFNLDGFKDTTAFVKANEGALSFDAGCPLIDGVTSKAITDRLTHTNNGAADAGDHFATFQTLAIVVSVDKTLVNKGGPIVASWASTHKVP